MKPRHPREGPSPQMRVGPWPRGLWDRSTCRGRAVGRRGGQSSNPGSGVRPCRSLSRGAVCPRGGGWRYLVEDVVGQAPRGSGWYPGAGVLLRGLGGTRVQRDRPGGRRWLWPGLGVMQGTENWLWSLGFLVGGSSRAQSTRWPPGCPGHYFLVGCSPWHSGRGGTTGIWFQRVPVGLGWVSGQEEWEWGTGGRVHLLQSPRTCSLPAPRAWSSGAMGAE